MKNLIKYVIYVFVLSVVFVCGRIVVYKIMICLGIPGVIFKILSYLCLLPYTYLVFRANKKFFDFVPTTNRDEKK